MGPAHAPCLSHSLGNGSVVVELGANDGLHMSNGYFFERQLGWRSVCIEANPTVFHALVQNRPGCINIHALVGRPEGTSTVAPHVSSPSTQAATAATTVTAHTVVLHPSVAPPLPEASRGRVA